MPVLEVVNLAGQAVGQVELADDVFAGKVNPHLLHESVRHYLARRRAGTHKTKAKGEVSGAGRKLWRQKGTGRARIGSIRSPLWRKGGTVHGPQPRSYDYRIPRQMILGALRSALSSKLAESKLTVVEGWTLESHKTKLLRQALNKLDGDSRSMLLVNTTDNTSDNVNLQRASRNLPGVTLLPSSMLEPYDLLRHERLLLSREAAERLSRALTRGEPGATDAHGESEARARAAASQPASVAKTKARPRAKAMKAVAAGKARGKGKAGTRKRSAKRAPKRKE